MYCIRAAFGALPQSISHTMVAVVAVAAELARELARARQLVDNLQLGSRKQSSGRRRARERKGMF